MIHQMQNLIPVTKAAALLNTVPSWVLCRASEDHITTRLVDDEVFVDFDALCASRARFALDAPAVRKRGRSGQIPEGSVTIKISDRLAERVQAYADARGLSRNRAGVLLLVKALMQEGL